MDRPQRVRPNRTLPMYENLIHSTKNIQALLRLPIAKGCQSWSFSFGGVLQKGQPPVQEYTEKALLPILGKPSRIDVAF